MSSSIETLIDLGLGVGQISDAMDELGLRNNAGGGYRLLGGAGGTIFGRAFTLRQVVAEPGTEAVTRQGEAALTLASPGDILVIDAAGATDIATWGEGHALRALQNGLHGVIVHGATRDAEALMRRELPVLCRGTTPVRSKGRLHTVGIGEAVDIAGVRIATGDLVVVGLDGIVAVSQEDEVRVLEKAAAILAVEQTRDRALEEGIFRAGGQT